MLSRTGRDALQMVHLQEVLHHVAHRIEIVPSGKIARKAHPVSAEDRQSVHKAADRPGIVLVLESHCE